jgi:hypothetical protein
MKENEKERDKHQPANWLHGAHRHLITTLLLAPGASNSHEFSSTYHLTGKESARLEVTFHR